MVYDVLTRIEIYVALRKESVDRNWFMMYLLALKFMSLSARRAWIEIAAVYRGQAPLAVALRKESVDRNLTVSVTPTARQCRSPQGERG